MYRFGCFFRSFLLNSTVQCPVLSEPACAQQIFALELCSRSFSKAARLAFLVVPVLVKPSLFRN